MAIGAHELLLIVRAQNQASALLGRVGRDVRRLQNLRDANIQRSAIANRLARNQIQQVQQLSKMESVLAADGKTRLQHEQSIARNSLQQLNLKNRLANLEVRRTGLERTSANLEVQRLRLVRQELGIESALEKVELRRQTINNQIGRIGTQQLRNSVQLQQLNRQAYSLQTGLEERQLRALKARRTYERLQRAGIGGAALSDAQTRVRIARRRVRESQMAIAEIPGQRGVLESVGRNLTGDIAAAETQLKMLGTTERQIAQDANILAERHKVLTKQLANVQARTAAVDGVEKELNRELAINSRQLGIINAQWEEHKAAVAQAAETIGVLREEEKVLNAQLAEQNALIARQNLDRLRTGATAIGHLGRVLQVTGLIGTAVFAGLAISAAHFNTEATRVATQTGAINSSARTVVANSQRVTKAIEQTMQVIPANQNDLSDALYNIYSSMNTTFNGGTRLLKLFGQVWVAGGMLGSINDVSDALITLGNNWHISSNNMAAWRKIAASTLATVRFGRLTVEQYTTTMNQLAPAFHGAGQSIQEMNGALAFLTRLLPSQRVTAAGIARMMELLQRFAAHPASGFESLAKDIQDAKGNLLPLNQILDIFITKYPKLKTGGVFLTNFFKMISNQQGTIQARRALQGFIRNFDQYRDIIKKTSGDTNEFNRSLKTMQQSTGVKWAQFVNDLRELGLELGGAVVPMLLKMAAPLAHLAKWFNGLSDSSKTMIGRFLAISAVGTLLIGSIAAIAGSLAGMIISMRILRGESKTLGAMFGLMGAEAGMANPMLIAVVGSLALLLPLLIKHPQAIGNFVKSLGGLKNIAHAVTIAFTAMTALKVATWLFNTERAAIVAGAEITKIRAALTGLRMMAPIVISVIVSYTLLKGLADKFNNESHNALTKAISKVPIVGRYFAAGAEAGEEFGKAFNKKVAFWIDKNLVRSKALAKAANDIAVKNMASFKEVSEMQAITEQHQIQVSNTVPAYAKLAAQTDLVKKDWQDIDRIFRTFVDTIPESISGMATLHDKTVKAFAVGQMDKQYLKALQNVSKLQTAYDNKGTLANARTYYAALKKLNTRYNTDVYKQYTSDFLGRTDKATKETIRNRSKISKTQFFSELKNVVALRNAYLKSHSQADQQAFFNARKKLMKESSDSERQYLTDSITRTNQAYAKQTAAHKAALRKEAADRKEAIRLQNQTYADALSNLAGAYNQFFSEQQSNFGNLFQGPYMTGMASTGWAFNPGPKDVLKDLTGQVFQYNRFNKLISQVQKRGGPRELVNQLRAAGPAAMNDIYAITKMSAPQWRQFVSSFNAGQEAVKKNTMAQLTAQIKMYRTHGQNVAKAIVAGITSEDTKLQSALERLLEKQFGLKPAPGYRAKPHKGNMINSNNTTIHVTGHPTDHQTKASIKHSMFKMRSHTRGSW